MSKRKTIWEQLVEKKAEFIGGVLSEHDSIMGTEKTIITDIKFDQDGNSCWFGIEGEDFSCGFNTKYGGISGSGVHDLNFSTTGLNFGIDKKGERHE